MTTGPSAGATGSPCHSVAPDSALKIELSASIAEAVRTALTASILWKVRALASIVRTRRGSVSGSPSSPEARSGPRPPTASPPQETSLIRFRPPFSALAECEPASLRDLCQPFAPGGAVFSTAPVAPIVALAAGKRVGAIAAEELVVPGSSEQLIAPRTAAKKISAASADHGVLSTPPRGSRPFSWCLSRHRLAQSRRWLLCDRRKRVWMACILQPADRLHRGLHRRD